MATGDKALNPSFDISCMQAHWTHLCHLRLLEDPKGCHWASIATNSLRIGTVNGRRGSHCQGAPRLDKTQPRRKNICQIERRKRAERSSSCRAPISVIKSIFVLSRIIELSWFLLWSAMAMLRKHLSIQRSDSTFLFRLSFWEEIVHMSWVYIIYCVKFVYGVKFVVACYCHRRWSIFSSRCRLPGRAQQKINQSSLNHPYIWKWRA